MKILHFKKLNSTNIKAKEFAKQKKSDLVIVADRQIKGKGRFNRKWSSYLGGLYFSILLKEKDVERIKYLTFIAALGVVKSLKKETGLNSKIKWPNDVYVKNKKISGILTENLLGKENYSVVGVGINLNQIKFAGKLYTTATSLRIELGKEFDGRAILNEFLKEFRRLYKDYEESKFKRILDLYKKNCDTIGRNIQVKTMKKTFKGKAININQDCELVVKLNNNRIMKINEGDVFILGK